MYGDKNIKLRQVVLAIEARQMEHYTVYIVAI